jgi:hypothetical protein
MRVVKTLTGTQKLGFGTFEARVEVRQCTNYYCLTMGFTPTVLEPSCTKTVPKPYPIVIPGLTSSEKQIPRNC